MITILHKICVVIAIISVCLFVADSVAGLYCTTKLEKEVKHLLVESKDPSFVFDNESRRDQLYKDSFGARQLMQRLSGEGITFIIMSIVIHFLRKKKMSTRQVEFTA